MMINITEQWKWILALALVAMPFILDIKQVWPIYALTAFWIIWMIYKPDRIKVGVILLFAVLLIPFMYFWGLGAALTGTPAEEKGTVLKTYVAESISTRMFQITTGKEMDTVGERAREGVMKHQWWFIPLLCVMQVTAVSIISNRDKSRETLHGSARFISPAEANLMGHKEGFLLGKDKKTNKEVVLPSKEVHEHILVVGAPGAGKTTGIFIPNILRIAEKGSYANLVITDPKTELLAVCGPKLLEEGYDVYVYHPYNPELSNAWNMLYYAKDWEAVDDMVLSILRNTSAGGKADPYWEQQSNMLLDLICTHLRSTLGEKATMNHVQALAGATRPTDIEIQLRNSPNPKIRMNALGFFSKLEKNDKIISSVMGDMPRRLKLWTIDPVRATTSQNEINFEDLCSNKKVALFVVTPLDKKEQLKPLFATFFGQMFKTIQEKGRELGKLPRPLWLMLDEMANLGTIPNFDNFLTVVRGYNVGLVSGIQSISQLNELYGKERANTILDACATYIISPRIGKDDAKYFSDMLGMTTVQTIDHQYNSTLLYRDYTHKREKMAAVKRVLMGPDEIRALDKSKDLLVVAGNRRPVHIAPAIYFMDNRWKKLGKECYEEENMRERRKRFNRENRGLPELPIPSEEDMMLETALVTSQTEIEEDKGENRGPIYDSQKKESKKLTENTATDSTPERENNKENENKLDYGKVEVKKIKKGNPFEKDKE